MGDSEVILISKTGDWANIGAIFSVCLNKIGISSRSFTQRKASNNPFIHSEVYDRFPEIVENSITKKTKAIIWMHSLKFNIKCDLTGIKTAVFHGGTEYRIRSNQANKLFKNVDIVFIQTAELLPLCDRNDRIWLLPPAFIGDVEPSFSIQNKKLLIGHFPSNGMGKYLEKKDLKGTLSINKVMKKFEKFVDYRYSDGNESWLNNLKRVKECDIYIESLNSDSTSKNKHDWSIAALESSALGCITITNFKYGENDYLKEYGEHTLQVANTMEELEQKLDYLLSLPKYELERLKVESHLWATSTHSLESIGLRIKNGLKI